MKKTLQLIVVFVFIGASIFVIFKFFIAPQQDIEKLKEAAGSGVKNIDVQNLIKRNFKTEQTDILEDKRFQSLVDNSVVLSPLEEIEAGKNNPFVSE